VTRLSTVNAVVAGEKKTSDSALTGLYHLVQRSPELLSGIIRTYQPKDEDGDQLPPERKNVQTRVRADVIPAINDALTRMFDLQLTQDTANCTAIADVIVDGRVLIPAAPVTYLLWLDKMLVNLRTIVDKLPTLDPAEVWSWDESLGVYRAEPARTVRSKKIPRNHVKAEATDRHPAQVDVYYEDVAQGQWTAVKLSGAVPAALVQALTLRVKTLLEAVKVAREEANTTNADPRQAGAAVFDYLFGEFGTAGDRAAP
jgi:hypothetical protein